MAEQISERQAAYLNDLLAREERESMNLWDIYRELVVQSNALDAQIATANSREERRRLWAQSEALIAAARAVFAATLQDPPAEQLKYELQRVVHQAEYAVQIATSASLY